MPELEDRLYLKDVDNLVAPKGSALLPAQIIELVGKHYDSPVQPEYALSEWIECLYVGKKQSYLNDSVYQSFRAYINSFFSTDAEGKMYTGISEFSFSYEAPDGNSNEVYNVRWVIPYRDEHNTEMIFRIRLNVIDYVKDDRE